MKINVITLFPEMFAAFFEVGVVGQAVKAGKIKVQIYNPRAHTIDVHQTVDDRPFGGGDGMIMIPGPLAAVLDELKSKNELGYVIYMSPQGAQWKDASARAMAAATEDDKQVLTLICGRYGGIDQRLIDLYVDEEISIGDYVISGGEIAAMVVMDSVARFLPGVLGNEDSPEIESFAQGLLECPQWTRPREFKGLSVPEVMLSGHHGNIQMAKSNVSLLRTWLLRPELLGEPAEGGKSPNLRAAQKWADGQSDHSLLQFGFSDLQVQKLRKRGHHDETL